MAAHVESDDMPALHSLSGTDFDDSDSDDDSDDDNERIRRRQLLRGPSYPVSQMTPLSISPVWDEINAQLNIRLTGPDSLEGFCEGAHFARSRLTKTSSALLNDSTQANAALFCLEQIKDAHVAEDVRVAFAKLLPHSLSYAKKLPELTTAIGTLLTQHPTIYKSLPQVTMEGITDYLGRLHSTSRPQKPSTAAGAVSSVSPTSQRRPGTVRKSSTKATISKASTTPTSSTTRRTAQKSSPPSQPPLTTESKYRTRSPTRPVPHTFLVPSHSARTQSSPSTSRDASTGSRVPQKAPTAPRSPPSTGLNISIPSQPQPTPYTQSSTQTQPSLDAAQQSVTGSRTPEEPDDFKHLGHGRADKKSHPMSIEQKRKSSTVSGGKLKSLPPFPGMSTSSNNQNNQQNAIFHRIRTVNVKGGVFMKTGTTVILPHCEQVVLQIKPVSNESMLKCQCTYQ